MLLLAIKTPGASLCFRSLRMRKTSWACFFCSGFWLLRRAIQYPTGSMYVILTYICQTNGPNLGKYTYIYTYTWILWVWRSKNNTLTKHWLMTRAIHLVLFDVGIGSNHQASLIHFINWMPGDWKVFWWMTFNALSCCPSIVSEAMLGNWSSNSRWAGPRADRYRWSDMGPL